MAKASRPVQKPVDTHSKSPAWTIELPAASFGDGMEFANTYAPPVVGEIARLGHGIDINITELEGNKEELLEAFQECSEGRCTCPTQEYEKMESLNIVDAEKNIQLSIKSKDNKVIDPKEIEKCLEYTKNKLSKS